MGAVEAQIQEEGFLKDLLCQEKEVLREWNITLEQEEIMWKEKSRISWLQLEIQSSSMSQP